MRLLARRGIEAAITLALLASLAFMLAHAMPGGPAYSILGLKATPAGVSAVNLQLGLDVPWWRQYAIWWAHLAQGDLGTSYLLNRPVSAVIAAYAVNSLALCGAGFTAGLALAIACGLVIGTGGTGARLLEGAAIGLYAMPGFFLGSILLLIFSVWLHWLPGGGVVDARLAAPGLRDWAAHLLLPALTLALLVFPAPAQLFAHAVATERAQPYVRAAAAKGLTPLAVLRRHVMPNALRPLIGWAGAALPGVLAGAVVVESVFDYPGLGWLLWRSAVGRDYPVLLGVVLVLGTAAVLGNLLADLVNGWLDPRARFR